MATSTTRRTGDIMHTQYATRSRSRVARPVGLLAAAGLAMAVVAGCGDDDEGSAQEKYCQAGESLEASVTALAGLDLVAEGTAVQSVGTAAQGVYATSSDCP